MKYELQARRDDSTGELGLALAAVDIPDQPMVDVDGINIAHDIVEHVNGFARIGTIADELEALGAIWYVRGQWGRLCGEREPELGIARDVTRMWEDYAAGVCFPTEHALAKKTRRHCYAEDALRTIIAEAGLPREAKRYADAVLILMRTGYAKARRKYEPRGRFFANSLFWSIQEAVAPHASSKYFKLEGTRYLLQTKGTEATCHMIEEDY